MNFPSWKTHVSLDENANKHANKQIVFGTRLGNGVSPPLIRFYITVENGIRSAPLLHANSQSWWTRMLDSTSSACIMHSLLTFHGPGKMVTNANRARTGCCGASK